MDGNLALRVRHDATGNRAWVEDLRGTLWLHIEVHSWTPSAWKRMLSWRKPGLAKLGRPVYVSALDGSREERLCRMAGMRVCARLGSGKKIWQLGHASR